MTKNPFLNAILAVAYIALVASVMFYGPKLAGDKLTGDKDTLIAPIAFISLFTLSAAVMGYLFLSTPIQFFLEGKKREGVTLFLRTVLIFAGITILIFFALFSRIL